MTKAEQTLDEEFKKYDKALKTASRSRDVPGFELPAMRQHAMEFNEWCDDNAWQKGHDTNLWYHGLNEYGEFMQCVTYPELYDQFNNSKP